MLILLDYHSSGSNNCYCLYLLVINNYESKYLVIVNCETIYGRLVVSTGHVMKTYLLFGDSNIEAIPLSDVRLLVFIHCNSLFAIKLSDFFISFY
jgi:hypothetical protein